MTRDTAVIGLGNMGRGIARNLDRAGRLAAAWDIAEAARTNAGLPPDRRIEFRIGIHLGNIVEGA